MTAQQLTFQWMQVGRCVAGVDEAGRGPLAGPVVAAAVILHPQRPIQGLRDSKKLTERRRDELAVIIREQAMGFAIASAAVSEIDDINILQASLLAMSRAVAGLSMRPDHVLVDGNKTPDIDLPVTAIVKGDDREDCIAAASILAKVERDQLMLQLHAQHPEYGFDRHKGYPTKLHLQALRDHGVTAHHRCSFRPVREIIESLEGVT